MEYDEYSHNSRMVLFSQFSQTKNWNMKIICKQHFDRKKGFYINIVIRSLNDILAYV